MSTFSRVTKNLARPLAIAVLATLVLNALGSTDTPVAARDGRIAVFGTVVDAPYDGQLIVVTREGRITLTITEETKIVRKKDAIKLDKVKSGSSVTGYYTEDDGELLAGKLTFRKRNAKKAFEHVVGVVLNKSGNQLTVQTTDGKEVIINQPENPSDDDTRTGSLIATVVETDPESGEMDAAAIRTAEKTIDRLNESIGREITLAQEKLLKALMSATASIHLTLLYETLDEIQAEAQSKITEAFAEFQTNYTATLDENLIPPPLLLISGKVLSKTPVRWVVAANGNGRRSFVTVPGDVEVELLSGNDGTILDVTPSMFVEISATPQTETASPVAQSIKIIPLPVVLDNSGNGNNNDRTISGTILLVENGNSGTQKVIVVENPDGSDGAAAITEDTMITGGDDDLEPGQVVEVTLGDDGFSADEIEVVSSPTQPDTAEATPALPVKYKLKGKIQAVSGDSVILDDVYLTLDTASMSTDPLTVGQEIQFTVVVDESGRWVIIGVEP